MVIENHEKTELGVTSLTPLLAVIRSSKGVEVVFVHEQNSEFLQVLAHGYLVLTPSRMIVYTGDIDSSLFHTVDAATRPIFVEPIDGVVFALHSSSKSYVSACTIENDVATAAGYFEVQLAWEERVEFEILVNGRTIRCINSSEGGVHYCVTA